MALNITAGRFYCHHRRKTRSRKLLLGINDAGTHWHSISLMSSPLYYLTSSTCYTFFFSFFVLLFKLLTSLSYLLTASSMLAIFACISLSWDSIILSFPSFLKIFSILPPTGFPPCWELRILRNIRLSIVFSSGELLYSVDDDDENDSLSYHFGGMKILQLGIWKRPKRRSSA